MHTRLQGAPQRPVVRMDVLRGSASPRERFFLWNSGGLVYPLIPFPQIPGRAFTSDLSGQEFWLVVDKGFQPMGLVIGNCIYSMGAVRNWLVGIKSNFQGELKEYSELMYQARELALSRMQFEADQLGADGVIGVDIKVEFLHNAEWMEVTAIGTAIRWVGSGPHLPPTGQGRVMIPAG